MRRVDIVILALGLAAFSTAGRIAPAVAQEVEFPISPDPAECQVEPRSVDGLIVLWYGPGATLATETTLTEVTVPVGPPADEATIAGVVATVREVFACFEAGDFLRATALFTDNMVRGFGPEPGVTEEDARAFLAAPPEPESEEESQILAITDVLVLTDGRVGAFVVNWSEESGASTAYAIFVRQGDRWLVDELFDFGD